MSFDYKKEYKEFYLPKKKPSIVTIPSMNFIAIRGHGNPNDEDGEYKKALAVLYAIAYTIKMSKMGDHRIEGYFDYVVPPLEGLWAQAGENGIDFSRKENFEWISMIRLPDFVTPDDFEWAKQEAARKKNLDVSAAQFMTYEEGPCVQCLHVGSYDSEPATIAAMDEFARNEGYEPDLSDQRPHHVIYLSDPRRTAPERLKTVIRHPVRKVSDSRKQPK